MVYKCRGQFEDLTPERKNEVENLCKDTNFSRSLFVMSDDMIKDYCTKTNNKFEQLKNHLGNLEKIIKVDRNKMMSLDVSYTQIGDVLKSIMRTAIQRKDLYYSSISSYISTLTGKKVEYPKFETAMEKYIFWEKEWSGQEYYESSFEFNNQKLRVFVVSWGGAQICPFQPKNEHYKGYSYGARDVVVTNLGNGKVIRYSSLLPHMIKHHGFFEGPGCHYRIYPEKIIEVIGHLEKGKCYKTDIKDDTTGPTITACVPNSLGNYQVHNFKF